jgi:hypothetical protein
VVIETNSHRIKFPDNWQRGQLEGPALLLGPNREVVQISSAALSGLASVLMKSRALATLRDNATQSMRAAASDAELQIQNPLHESKSSSGNWFAEVHCTTLDGQTLFSQFATSGPKTVVLATVEAGAKYARSIETVRRAMQSIEWI